MRYNPKTGKWEWYPDGSEEAESVDGTPVPQVRSDRGQEWQFKDGKVSSGVDWDKEFQNYQIEQEQKRAEEEQKRKDEENALRLENERKAALEGKSVDEYLKAQDIRNNGNFFEKLWQGVQDTVNNVVQGNKTDVGEETLKKRKLEEGDDFIKNSLAADQELKRIEDQISKAKSGIVDNTQLQKEYDALPDDVKKQLEDYSRNSQDSGVGKLREFFGTRKDLPKPELWDKFESIVNPELKTTHFGGAATPNQYQENRIAKLEEMANIYRVYLGQMDNQRNVLAGIGREFNALNAESKAPFIGTIIDLEKNLQLNDIVKRYTAGEEINQEEMDLITEVRSKLIQQRLDLGYSQSVGSMIANMPTYMAEFFMTGGIASAGKAATTKVIGTAVEKGTAEAIVKGFARTAIGEFARTSIGFAPHIANSTAEYMLPRWDVVAGENGDSAIVELDQGDSFEDAFVKAGLGQYVENLSESAGLIVEEGLPFLKKAVLGRFLEKYASGAGETLTEETSKGIIKQIMAKGGWNGVIGEVFEEEIAEPAQAKIEGREYKDPITTPEGRERLLTETLGITVFAGFSAIPEVTINSANKIKNKLTGNVIEIPVKTDSKDLPEDYKPTVRLDTLGVKQFEDVTELLAPSATQNETERIKESISNNPEAWQPILDIASTSEDYSEFQTKVQDAIKNDGLQIPDILVGTNTEEKFRSNTENQNKTGENNLFALHNLSEGSLEKNISSGGLAAPSIAITKADTKFDSFGEITLVGNKDLVTPDKKTSTRVFSGDIYSPTVGDAVEYKKNYETTADLPANIQTIVQKANVNIDNVDTPRDLEELLKYEKVKPEEIKLVVNAVFTPVTRIKSTAKVSEDLAPLLKNREIATQIRESNSDYDLRLRLDSIPEARAAFDEIAQDLGRPDEVYEIIDEFTNQVFEARPATVDNIVASINQRLQIRGLDLRGSEDNWTVPARVFGYKEFRTVDEIREFQQLLTDAETASHEGEAKQAQFSDFVDIEITNMETSDGIEFEDSTALYNALNSEEALGELIKGLKPLPKLSDYDTKNIESLDAFNNDFEKIEKNNKKVMSEAIRYSGTHVEVSDIKKFVENINMDSFMERLDTTFKNLSTEYFEAKINRAVDLGEFVGAIVPNEISPELKQALVDKGLKVVEYSYFEPNDRFNKLADAFGEAKFRRLAEAEDFIGKKLSTEELINIRELNERMFGDRNVGVVEKIITPDGMEAVGKYASNWIEIADKQADATDTFYHEAVHKAIDVFLPGEAKLELFTYAQSKYGSQGLELEEKIAEDFINYVNGEKLSLPQKIIKIFKDLLGRIKGFQDHITPIESFYNNLLEGKLKENPRLIKLSENLFNTLNEINAARELSITQQQNETQLSTENQSTTNEEQNQERTTETPTETVWETAIAQKESIRSSLDEGEIEVLDIVQEIKDKSIEESAYKALEQLQTAQAGFRYSVEGEGGFREFRGQKSTFPDWFSLRTRTEIDDFLLKLPDNPLDWTPENNPFREGTRKYEAYGEFLNQLEPKSYEQILDEERSAFENFAGSTVEEFTQKLDNVVKQDIEARTTQTGQVALTQETKPVEAAPTTTTPIQRRQAAQTPIEQQVGNKLKNSKVYEKLLDTVDKDLQNSPQYERMNIKENLNRAINFVETNYTKAKRVALGLENPPANITEIAIRRAMATKALLDGDLGLYEQLVRSRSLRLTRLGQEVVSERGAVDQDNPEFYLQELTNRRMDIVGSKLPAPTESTQRSIIDRVINNKQITNKEKVNAYIDTEVKNIKKNLDVENIKISKAQEIIDLLTCK